MIVLWEDLMVRVTSPRRESTSLLTKLETLTGRWQRNRTNKAPGAVNRWRHQNNSIRVSIISWQFIIYDSNFHCLGHCRVRTAPWVRQLSDWQEMIASTATPWETTTATTAATSTWPTTPHTATPLLTTSTSAPTISTPKLTWRWRRKVFTKLLAQVKKMIAKVIISLNRILILL